MNYRFHKSTRSRIQGHNGKSLLELAGVNTSSVSWSKSAEERNQENLLEFLEEKSG